MINIKSSLVNIFLTNNINILCMSFMQNLTKFIFSLFFKIKK